MAESVSKVYADAVFELCCEEDKLDTVYEELKELDAILYDKESGAGELVEFLSTPVISDEEKIGVLKNIFEGRLDTLTLDFLCLLTEKGRFGFYDRIFEELRTLYNDKMNILEVTAVTSEPMSDRLAEKLKAKLEATTGRQVILTRKLDKSLIGGIVVRYGHTQLDSSVKTKLDKLKAQINSVIA